MLPKDSFPDIGKVCNATVLKTRYISISFQQINPLHYIYLPLLRPLPSRKVYQGTNRTHTQHPVLQHPSPQTLLRELNTAHTDTITSRHRHFRPSVWIPEPFLLPSPCVFRENPGVTTLTSPAPRIVRHGTRICSGFREFLLSLLRLRLPSKASGFACDFAIRECEPAGRTPG